MSSAQQTWELRHGPEVLGYLDVTANDFPWLNAHFRPRDSFATWRPVFDDELRLIDGVPDDIELWEASYRRIDEHLTLHKPSGQPVAEFLLHIEGETAWWRYSDEKFLAP